MSGGAASGYPRRETQKSRQQTAVGRTKVWGLTTLESHGSNPIHFPYKCVNVN